MDKYTLYISPYKRRAYHDKTTSLKLACNFLDNVSGALVIDCLGNSFRTKEELENYVENFRSIDRTGQDNTLTSGITLSENSDRQLSEADSDRTESSSERDNQWD